MRRIAPPKKQGHKLPKKTKRPVAQLRCLKGIGHLWIQCIHLQFFHADIHDVSDIKCSKIFVHDPA